MIFTGTDWTTVVTGAGVVIAVLGGGVKLWRKVEKDNPGLIKAIPSKVVTVVDDAAKFVEHIVTSPLFAGLAAKGKVEAHHVLDKLTQTTAVSEAKTVLLAIGKVYDALTDAEKLKAEVTLKLALSGIGINMADKQIQAVFTEAQQAIDTAKLTPMFKASFTPDPAVDPAATTQSA